ncbi:Uma2 family endonuclease [Nonomuraea jiangxiensis]|uniref:Putative restriction endonuclease n=1 Tax=Nonomuraea jiangxiensis TaxID=633440 RepID=A0A1G9M523_9ACTN|nr:Uma2 family endonuclease [Nonomuraea jiangxiensis]SDL69402.1 Putative restriction endonuclease [Nonomuraea jiangxiensis]
MTAEAVIPEMTTSSLPDWVFPPPGGFVAEDLDRIPDLPAHTELIDGSLVFVSPQASFRMRVLSLLELEVRRAAPEHLRVRREMSLILDTSQRPEPDLMVVEAKATLPGDETFYRPADTLLVVEVVSPESKLRDRHRKPALYAQAGIPHFWRIENDSDKPVAYVYALDPATRTYALTGIHYESLKLTVPFDLAIDLTEIDKI